MKISLITSRLPLWLGCLVAGIVYTNIALAMDLKTVHITNSQSGKTHVFKVEVARTSQELQQGLMNRLSLPKDQGMLFVLPEPQVIKMWMKNTFISLDMIFIDRLGKIVWIEHHTQPMTTHAVGPDQPVMMALEINGGIAKSMGIEVGNQVSVAN